jgi:hypothetical protein
MEIARTKNVMHACNSMKDDYTLFEQRLKDAYKQMKAHAN